MFLRTFVASLLLIILIGCQGMKDQLGLGKRSPDEFTVVTRAPLTIPPGFALRPPQPGITRPQESSAVQRAEAALISTVQDPSGNLPESNMQNRTAGELLFLDLAGTGLAEDDIRELINSDNAVLANTQDSFVDKIMFWQPPTSLGTVVNAQQEAQRLQENAALGKSPIEGATPIIKRRRKAILEDIF